MYLFESLWNWLIVLFYIIILLNISVQIFSEKYNTKENKAGYMANTSRRGGNAWFPTFRLVLTDGPTDGRTDGQSLL